MTQDIDVNLVPSEGPGWILGRIISELKERNQWSVGNFNHAADINFFINYYAASKLPRELRGHRGGLKAAWFTHIESPDFFRIADFIDVRFCHSQKYAREINGVSVTPGIDAVFQPRLRVGSQFRSYASGRKGEFLLQRIREEDFVEYVEPPDRRHMTDDAEWLNALRDWYSSLDVFLVTSLVEGGPVPAAEAVASGTQVVAPRDVGNLDALPGPRYKVGDPEELIEVLKRCLAPKLDVASSVQEWTWENFAVSVRETLKSAWEGRQR